MKQIHKNIIRGVALGLVWAVTSIIFDYFKLPVIASRIVFFFMGVIYTLI
jgi:hypothetical protein